MKKETQQNGLKSSFDKLLVPIISFLAISQIFKLLIIHSSLLVVSS